MSQIVVEDKLNTTLINKQLFLIKSLQEIRLGDLLNHTNKYSRYLSNKFQNISNGIKFLELEKIPVCTKSELMQNFDDWVTDKNLTLKKVKNYITNNSNIGKPLLNKYLVMESSGSTGIPGIFIHNLNAIFIYQALEATRRAYSSLLNQLLSHLYLNERLAYVGALKGHYAGIASIRYSKYIYPQLNAIIKEISIYDEYRKISKNLNDYYPTVLATYPSVALSLVEQKKLNELKISPREIWLGGENLDAHEKQYIESAFHSRVFNSYGASEFPPIAWECDFGKLHINSDWIILEAVDKKYQKVPMGTVSDTSLITNLCNFTQPIIRYDLGDQICYDPVCCACGNMLPTLKIIGRKANIFKFINDTGDQLSIPAIELTSLLEEYGFYNFKITQDSKLAITISLKDLNNTHEIIARITSILSSYFYQKKISGIKIKIDSIENLNSSKGSGKFK